MNIWIGDLHTFCCPPCRLRPWTSGWLPSAHMSPLSEGFSQLRLTSWGGRISSQSSVTWMPWMPRIFFKSPSDLGNETWLGRYHLVNWVHSPGSGLRGLPHLSAWVFAFGPSWPFVVLSKYSGNTRGKFSDLNEITVYYPTSGYSDEGFEGETVQSIVPNQDLPLVPSQNILG